jgi:hypothetical protein
VTFATIESKTLLSVDLPVRLPLPLTTTNPFTKRKKKKKKKKKKTKKKFKFNSFLPFAFDFFFPCGGLRVPIEQEFDEFGRIAMILHLI